MPAVLFFAAALVAGPPPGETVISSIDLKAPFHTRSAWTFTARQGREVRDSYFDDEKMPGPIAFCLSRDAGKTCDPAVTGRFAETRPDDPDAFPQFLLAARVEHLPGKAARPVLLLRTATRYNYNGDHGVRTELVFYDQARDRFAVAYDYLTLHNNNQEVRLVTSGPLGGDVVAVEPTNNKPFGYWVVVNRLGGDDAYHQILRYRSATHYGDGNPLAVIDAEMPNIQKRLGKWRPGRPLPLPAGKCPKPHLVKTVLWCE